MQQKHRRTITYKSESRTAVDSFDWGREREQLIGQSAASLCYLDEIVVQKAQHNELCNDTMETLCHRFFSIIYLPQIKPQLTCSFSLFIVVNRNNCDDLAQKELKGFMANLSSNSAMTKPYHTRHHRNRHKNPHYHHKMLKRKVDMRDFETLKVLGTGAYGKVI